LAEGKREEQRGMERREERLTMVDERRRGRATGATPRHGNNGSGVNEGEVSREEVLGDVGGRRE
jgi:hypothetical protein